MGKFKVGDKAELIEKDSAIVAGAELRTELTILEVGEFSGGNKYRVSYTAENGEFVNNGLVDDRNIRLIERKPTKNQRITALENEVAELKSIVEGLRKSEINAETVSRITGVALSEGAGLTITETLENVIEFEGAKYRKVEREARAGDVVVFRVNETSEHHSSTNEPYLVISEYDVPRFAGYTGTAYKVYAEDHNRTPETVDVYERIEPSTSDVDGEALMKRGNDDWQPISKEEFAEIISEKPTNQLRAEIIEKAKGFVVKHGEGFGFDVENRVVAASKLHKQGITNYSALIGYAKCNPNDVFNERIGKAIALGRALGLDVSEFEGAVQPTIPVVGMVVKYIKSKRTVRVMPEDTNGVDVETETYLSTSRMTPSDTQIINDTNAIYSSEVK